LNYQAGKLYLYFTDTFICHRTREAVCTRRAAHRPPARAPDAAPVARRHHGGEEPWLRGRAPPPRATGPSRDPPPRGPHGPALRHPHHRGDQARHVHPP